MTGLYCAAAGAAAAVVVVAPTPVTFNQLTCDVCFDCGEGDTLGS